MWTFARTPPVANSVKVAVPVTPEPLLDSSVALAVVPSGGFAEAHPAQISAAAARLSGAVHLILFMTPPLLLGSYFECGFEGRLGSPPNRGVIELATRLGERTQLVSLRQIPPVEVSRVLLLFCVASGALVSIATQGKISEFAGGFAVGAGVALLFSRLKSAPEAKTPPAKEDTA